jgi:hypothetical protein
MYWNKTESILYVSFTHKALGSFKHPPFDNFICFPLGLVPKEESGSFRLIHDLSFPKGGSVNFWTPPEYTLVSYQNIETVIELVQENDHLRIFPSTSMVIWKFLISLFYN